MNERATLRAISGIGGKGPACFLLEARGLRLLLDLGYGPQPGLFPDVDGIGKVDALLLSHGHRDHAGGLSLLEKIGDPPIYATEFVAQGLAPEHETRILPLHGTADVLGVAVKTGRSGHAPGGIWMRFDLGNGLLYMGDHCRASILYAFDPPPPASTVMVDGSYGVDDVAPVARFAKFDRLTHSPGVLLPVPGDGRGPEIALYLARQGCTTLRFDDALRSALDQLADHGQAFLWNDIAGEMRPIIAAAARIGNPSGVTLASRADGTSGEAARLINSWESSPTPEIIFTGYVPPGTPAERLVKNGRASYLRWNIHPHLSENAQLIVATKAKTVVPAFCERDHLALLSAAFAPARVTFDTPLEI